ncbi:MAG: insulinase family protein, partial [Phycisphaerales bacterium]|nr:insulinase family protein [Phycisphaerales bacterium]
MRWLSLILLAGLCSAAIAQTWKVEKYTLPNGMSVILHEDHSLPVACVNIWYRVGALDEPPGRSGFAHLFEHLMFMGTRRVPGNQFDVLMETGGGSNNATTNLFRTNYFSSGPAKLLPTLLWLDADRLEDMGLTMTQEKLDKQRDVVRNERRQSLENAPYGKGGFALYQMIYPAGHPYHDEVIGTHADLEAATVDNVRDFFANFYVPNNAALVVAGDFDSAAIKPLIDGLFGSLPRGGEVPRRKVEPVKLDRVLRHSTIDKVQLPKIAMAFFSPATFQDGDAEMELAADVLASGKSSRLYKRLVYTDQTCTDVNAYQDGAQLSSLFIVEAYAKPGADLSAIEKAMDEELARLAAEGPTAAELDQRKNARETAMVSSMQSIESRADRLNQYEYFWGEPNSFSRDLQRYRAVTPASMKTWAAKVLTPNARAIVYVLPEEPQRQPVARDTRPAEAMTKAFDPPKPQTFKLSNGAPVMLWSRSDLPLVSLGLLIQPGGALDAAETAGLSVLATQMIEEGAGERDALAFSEALQQIGASFNAGADRETVQVSLSVLKRNIDPAVGLFADAILRPRMEAREWDRVRAIHLDQLQQNADEPRYVANRVGEALLFGDQNAYGRPADGTPDSVAKLSVDQIKQRWAELFQPAGATFIVVGDLTADEARTKLDAAFGKWQGAGARSKAVADWSIPKQDKLRVAIVHRPEAVQTMVRFVMPGFASRDERRAGLDMLNTIVGGSFTSRLNQNLREDKGYTYGARSSFVREPATGCFVASAAVR